jgi:AraC-like DNA-binding protein
MERSFIRRLPAVRGVEVFGASFTQFSYARHSHDSYAFGAVESGAMRFWHDGADYLAARGDVIAINPGEVHDGRTEASTGCRYHMLYVECSVIEDVLAQAAPCSRGFSALKGPVLRDASLARRIRHFARATREPLEEQCEVAYLLLRLFTRHGMPPLSPRPAAAESQCVARAKNYMAERLGEPIHLDDISRVARLSAFHFLRTFKRATGMAPHAYLNQIRLERARQLLSAGESPAQVAAATGFVDQSHLTRRFKGAFGVTPGQYRAAL